MASTRIRTLRNTVLDGLTAPARVVFCAMITMVLFTGLLAGTALDPFVQSGAIPALTGDQEVLRARTLHDGRWLVWLWSARGALSWSPALLFLFVLFWVMASAIIAQTIFADDRMPWRGLLATIAL